VQHAGLNITIAAVTDQGPDCFALVGAMICRCPGLGRPPPSRSVPGRPGLIAFIPGDDAGQLRVYDARTGAVLRELTVPAGRQTAYSPNFKYAAQVDRGAGLLTVYTLDGDTYRVSGTLNAAALGGEGLALVNADFVPRTGRLGVELDGGDGAMHKTVGIDPADPGRPLGTLPAFPSQLADSSGEPADAVHVEIPSLPAARDVSVHRSTRELVEPINGVNIHEPLVSIVVGRANCAVERRRPPHACEWLSLLPSCTSAGAYFPAGNDDVGAMTA
jgi:hypothetical protein